MPSIKHLHKKIIILGCITTLFGCDSPQYVPVEELHPQYAMNHSIGQSYVVRQGDTLYAIAFLYDKNVQELAAFNRLTYPYSLRVGQTIQLGGRASTPRTVQTANHWQHFRQKVSSKIYGKWLRPTQGRVEMDNKGVRILGKERQSIFASQNGVVAYAGNGLPGYGQLILIKHDSDYLTAYAFNSSILVKEGQSVRAGQTIATMGQLSSGVWGLHFELRHRGVAVNPLPYLH